MVAQPTAGSVHIANDVLADLAGYTALEGYGVVGMASPTMADGVAKLLTRKNLRKGVLVESDADGVSIDLYVVIEHGTNLTEVSHNLANRVRYVLTDVAGVSVKRVEIHVVEVKVRQAK